MDVYTSYCKSPLGQLKLECSDNYITAVLFMDREDPLPSVTHPLLKECEQQLNEYFEGKRKLFTLPCNQNGTSFQLKVWELLTHIPYGKTISYHSLALQYGDPKAIRAVAAANGKNNLAIIVPCHRVIGSDHSLTGYAGGLWRKKWLLDHESSNHLGVHQLTIL